jgi:hypothetical protein
VTHAWSQSDEHATDDRCGAAQQQNAADGAARRR